MSTTVASSDEVDAVAAVGALGGANAVAEARHSARTSWPSWVLDLTLLWLRSGLSQQRRTRS